MVNLSSNNSNNINLSGQTQRNVNVSTPNTNNVDANTMGNSQRARSWAIGEGLIDGEDYSAKHYAQLAKISEDIASGTIANIEEIEQQALDSITTGIGEIETAKESALSLIDTTKDDAIDDIDTVKSNSLIDIETSATNKITLINNTASSFEADLTLLTQRAETAATSAESSAINANSSATSADTSATAAATSATNASNSESNAQDSATAAATSASNANQSATSASNSASDAAISASSASTSATNASNYATSSSTSATSAANSASAALISETNAANSANDASDYADNASASATSASTSASNAATSESNASTYASNAYSFASSASLSATNAGNSASSASQSETNAQSYMNSANTYASNASSSATNAATSETNASNSAIAAATSEDNAEIWAEGTDEQVQSLGGVHSSKGWSEISASGQINSDWAETDITSKAYILNKPTNYVTTDTAQYISGRKTFLGAKAIYFKQSSPSDRLGFTLYDTTNREVGGLEYRPNTIDDKAILAINCPASASSTVVGGNYVGFRYWGNVNIVAPRPTRGTYFIPVKFTDGTNTVTANNNGTLNISALLPDVSNFVTNSSLATTLADYALTADIPTKTSDLTNDSSYITNLALNGYATETWVTNQGYVNRIALISYLNNYVTNLALTTTLADYALLTDIPTVNNGTLTIQKNGATIGTFTANDTNDVTANISVPTSISNLTDDTATYPIDKADTLTGLMVSVSELNYVDGVTGNIQTQINNKADITLSNVSSIDSNSAVQTALDAKVNTADIWYNSSNATLYIGVPQS